MPMLSLRRGGDDEKRGGQSPVGGGCPVGAGRDCPRMKRWGLSLVGCGRLFGLAGVLAPGRRIWYNLRQMNCQERQIPRCGETARRTPCRRVSFLTCNFGVFSRGGGNYLLDRRGAIVAPVRLGFSSTSFTTLTPYTSHPFVSSGGLLFHMHTTLAPRRECQCANYRCGRQER